MKFSHSLTAAAAIIAAGCGSGNGPDHASMLITPEGILAHTRTLSSDEFEGRAPGTEGETKSVEYLAGQFRSLGLEPGNPDGSYFQRAPLAGITSSVTGSIRAGSRTIALNPLQDFVGVSRPLQPSNEVANSDIVFVGYGVVAPEYQWDDYKGLDVRGKTLLMLINDPPTPDEKLFKGKAMTYYGRWTYKYEIASEKGAAAAIIIHETGPAGYPFEVVTGSWGRENFDLQAGDGNKARVKVESWISLDKAKELLAASGHDFDTLKQQAVSRDFRPVVIGAKATLRAVNKIRSVDSRNVIARLPGSDPTLRDQYVVYSAHWDHLGRDPNLQGDQIFNGALDNASGAAGLLELAKAFAALDPRPKRTILFLSVTAEEKGLLGARYYAAHPLYPLARTAANINMDGVNQWGRTRDIVVVGRGQSTLEDTLEQAARQRGRTLKDDPEPEKGFYFRSDHFEFAKLGVPALYTDSGEEYLDKPAGFAEKRRSEYTANDYHKVSDEVKPDWDLTGAAEDLRLLFDVGYRVAEDPKMPEWKPGSEFKAVREASLQR
ncbi:MAG: M28 family metallopeptidase [Bryobacteraceae bacterium]